MYGYDVVMTAPVRIASWNIAGREIAWRALATDGALDLALLQEASPPPPGVVLETVPSDSEAWSTAGNTKRDFCTAIARFSGRVQLRRNGVARVGERKNDEVGVSRPGTLALAEATLPNGETVTVGSMYGFWESPIGSKWIYADASVHRLISDLSVLIGAQRGHRILLAGDLNILHGYGEDGSAYWAARYRTVFDRMEAIGLPFVGPQFPNGRRADPRPEELPAGSNNVPTYRTSAGGVSRQLDYVFASRELHDRLTVRALNAPEEWGPSDHCRTSIDVEV